MSKKPKSIFKKIIVSFLIIISLLIIGIASLPLMFKNDIIELIKSESNNQLDAMVDFEDVDLKLLSTFPHLTLEINQLSIIGEGTFKNLVLADINKIGVELDLWKIIMDGKYEVKYIELDQPKIHIKVLSDGQANYDIYHSQDSINIETNENVASSSPFEFKINKYQFNQALFIYDDATYATKLKLKGFNHKGSFNMVGEKYQLQTQSKIEDFDLEYEKVKYFNNSIIDILFNGEVEFINEDIRLVITENTTKINQLQMALKGDFTMREKDYLMNLSFSTLDQTFKSLFSIVPGVYKSDFNNINTNGDFKLNGLLKGIYSDSLMPQINIDIGVDNGYFKYPELNDPVDNINMKLNIDFPGGEDLDLLKFNLDNFSLGFLSSSFRTKINASKLLTDPSLMGTINSNISFSDIERVIPLEAQTISGNLYSNINLKGSLSSIENEKYEDFNASGKFTIKALKYSSSDLNYDINLRKFDFEFHPEKLILNDMSLLIGKSDVYMDGEFGNYMQYVLNDELLSGSLNIKSEVFNIDELYDDSYTDTVEADENIISEKDTVIIDNEVFILPDNIDFVLNSNINSIIYDSLLIQDFNGQIELKKAKLNFNDLKLNIFDGDFKFNGDYIANSRKRAQMKFNIELNNISFDEAYLYFNPVKKYAPAVKYFEGDFNTILNLDLLIDENYNPIYDSLNSDGRLMSENVEIIDLPSLKQIELLGEDVLQNNKSIKDLSLFYHFKNGKLNIERTPLKLKEFEAIFYGATSINQQIDYTIETDVPISLVNSSKAGLGSLIGGSSILGDMKDPIPISINIGGTVTSPIFNTKLKGGIDNIKENVLSIGKEKVKEKIEDVKNELLLEAEKKAEKIVNEAKIKANQIRKEANNKAEKLESEAKKKNQIAHSEIKKQVKDLKQKGYNEAELLIKQANSPLAKLAAQKGADELKKSTDKKAKDLEKKLINKANSTEKTAFSAANKIRMEGNNKADLLEKKAQSEAKKLIDAAKNK